jgi:hypothetical protein
MTGVITDLGIELGKLVYWNRRVDATHENFVRANRDKLRIHSTILGCFMVGGFLGALAFKHFSFAATIPFAALLAVLAALPILDDVRLSLSKNRS